MANTIKKIVQKNKRHFRIRKRLGGTEAVPRLVVYRSNKYLYAQIINDKIGKTLVAISTIKLKAASKDTKNTKVDAALLAGENLAKLALTKKINKVVFDRGGYRYHGRVKALAEGARKGGLNF